LYGALDLAGSVFGAIDIEMLSKEWSEYEGNLVSSESKGEQDV
jgi:hypothetical protein